MRKVVLGLGLLVASVVYADVVSQNGIAKDSATGLIWQDEPYTQQEKEAYDNNKKNYGKAGNWEYAKQYCKDLRLGDFSDWRLPNIYELVTLIDNKKQSKPRSVDGLVNIAEYSYWSSTDSTKLPDSKWIAHYVYGNINYNWVKRDSYVRCVRGKELNYDNFIALSKDNIINAQSSLLDEIRPNTSQQNSNTSISKDIIVKEVFEDKVTSLVWQDDVDVVSSKKDFYTATTYCENLKKGKFNGYDNWRLPNVYELLTLLDNEKAITSISGLKMVSRNAYWSSSISSANASHVWSVGFGSGKNYQEDKDVGNNVRCVSGKILNYEILSSLKKKGVLKVAQSNIDDFSPTAEAKRKKEAEIVAQREAKERAEREKIAAKERAEREKREAYERAYACDDFYPGKNFKVITTGLFGGVQKARVVGVSKSSGKVSFDWYDDLSHEWRSEETTCTYLKTQMR